MLSIRRQKTSICHRFNSATNSPCIISRPMAAYYLSVCTISLYNFAKYSILLPPSFLSVSRPLASPQNKISWQRLIDHFEFIVTYFNCVLSRFTQRHLFASAKYLQALDRFFFSFFLDFSYILKVFIVTHVLFTLPLYTDSCTFSFLFFKCCYILL